jgi:hypothetical protein
MRILGLIFHFGRTKKTKRKTIKDFQNDLFILQGRDQFKKLLKLGQMPVAFL